MIRKFDPAVLFERWKSDPRLVAYKTQKAVLDAVAARKKAVLLTGFPISYIAEGGAEFIDLLHEAFDRGLAVTLYNRPIPFPRDRQEPNVYVLPLDQTWRISALNVLRDAAFVDGAWTMAAEAQESQLLGYTSEQRERWLAAFRHRQAAYGCQTMYTLLTDEQRTTVMSLGKRALGPSSELIGRVFFFHRDREALKKNAVKLVPKGLTLARVGFDWRAAERLFGSWKKMKRRGLVKATVTKDFAQVAAESFQSNVQLLSSTGWS